MTLIKFKNDTGSLLNKFPFMPTVFGDFFNDFVNGDAMNKEMLSYVPAVNISERANDFMIELAAPGVSKEDFKVEVENGILTISSQKSEEKKEGDSRFTRREFSYSSFKRSFSLPEHVQTDNIEATYNNGVLVLVLPKKDEAKQKPVKEIKIS